MPSNRQYHCLIAGLREYSWEADPKGFDARAIIDEIRSELSREDVRVVELLYGFYDVENIIALRNGGEYYAEFGNFTRAELGERKKMPMWLAPTIEAYEAGDDEEIDISARFEKALWTLYYAECARSHVKFLREWSEAERNIRNIVAAMAARRMGRAIVDVVVGDDDITGPLIRSQATDFGLKGNDNSFVARAVTILTDDSNLAERERKLDLLRWEIADELMEQHYFDIDFILAYLVKVNIIHRRQVLNSHSGGEFIERFVNELKILK